MCEYVCHCESIHIVFFKYFRMTFSTFDYILDNIKEHIMEGLHRPLIAPAECLSVTLR